MARQFGQFAFKLRNALLDQANLFDKQPHRFADQGSHRRVRISQRPADGFHPGACPLRNGKTELTAKTAQCVAVDYRAAASAIAIAS